MTPTELKHWKDVRAVVSEMAEKHPYSIRHDALENIDAIIAGVDMNEYPFPDIPSNIKALWLKLKKRKSKRRCPYTGVELEKK